MLKSKKIKEELGRLRSIEPDVDFVENTLRIITSTPQIPSIGRVGFFANILKKPAFSMAMALVLIILGSFAYLSISQDEEGLFLSALDRDMLISEAQAISLNIEDIERWQSENLAINEAIREISETQVNHLNQSLLEREKSELIEIEDQEEERNRTIEGLLDKLAL